jgi:hypothetical protein
MQQGPKLCEAVVGFRLFELGDSKGHTLHGILYRCTRQKQAIATMEAEQCFPPDTSGVFDILSFVEYHVLPFDPLEVLLILGDLYSHRRASLPTSACGLTN